MNRPSPLDETNKDPALLLVPSLRWKGLTQACSDLRHTFGLPDSAADTTTVSAPLRERQGASEIANDQRRVLQFAVIPNRELRPSGQMKPEPIERPLVWTREGAFNWMNGEILRIQSKEDDKRMAYLQSATNCILGATIWPEVPTARYDELNGMYSYLRELSPQTRSRSFFDYASDCARRLTGCGLKVYEGGTLTLWKALRLQRTATARRST